MVIGSKQPEQDILPAKHQWPFLHIVMQKDDMLLVWFNQEDCGISISSLSSVSPSVQAEIHNYIFRVNHNI